MYVIEVRNHTGSRMEHETAEDKDLLRNYLRRLEDEDCEILEDVEFLI